MSPASGVAGELEADRRASGGTTRSTHRVFAGDAARGQRQSLVEHVAVHGTLSLGSRGDPRWRARITDAIEAAGLLGRGGAGFPSGAKWSATRRGLRRPMVVVNAMEGEPASAKDVALLCLSPHLVLDGAEVVASVLGASDVVVCVRDDADGAAASVLEAIAERSRTTSVRASVRRPPSRFVTGEESALASWLDHGDPRPTHRVDKSVPLRVAHRELVVHNAETLAHVALIARHGPSWFRSVGSSDAPGTTLVTIGGAVRNPGVYEVELGLPVGAIVGRARGEDGVSAVLLGGYGGAWLAASSLDVPYAPGPLRAAGATMGVGVVIALPGRSCGLLETARITRYMAGESAGQCGPCVYGLADLATDLERLVEGRGPSDALTAIPSRLDAIDGRGACRHPDGVVRLVRSALHVFDADATAHALGRPCAASSTNAVLPLPGLRALRRRVS